jgi:hypothetical protein
MKKILMIAIGFLMTIGIYAQPPGGGGGGSGGRGPGGPPPGGGMQNRPSSSEDKLILEHFPEIPDLTLKQREKVGTVLSKEQKEIGKQMTKKHDIEKEINPDLSEKDMKKKMQKIEKIDKKIQDIRTKSNDKIKNELSEEQYQVFMEKRKDFRFRRYQQRPGMPPGHNNNFDDERPQDPPQDDDFF